MTGNPNIAVWVADRALSDPHLPAIKQGETILCYAALDGAASRFATLLAARGVRRGDRVALIMPNVAYFPIAYYAILRLGAVVVPMNPLLKAGEIAFAWSDSGAKVAVVFPLFAEEAQKAAGTTGTDVIVTVPQEFEQTLAGTEPTETVVELDPSDTAVILYTSGTTGQPKGAELSHANMVMNALTSNRLFGTLATDHDTHLLTLPLFHSFGQSVNMNAGFSVGATLVLLPRFDAAQAIGLMQRETITFFAGVPTMYWGLLGALTDDVDVDRIAGNLRRAVSGGSAMPVEILRQFQDRFHVQVLEGYGLSETSPVATFSDPQRDPRPGSIGVPIWGVQLKLVDGDWKTIEGADEVGEIAIRGHNVMKGYYNRPDATAEVMRDGWFRSGDLARRDEDGYYYIVDRAKDMIIRGGFNVYPREVEEVLQTHEAVSLVAVVGVPHEALGEEVKAYVIRNPGATITEYELVAWA